MSDIQQVIIDAFERRSELNAQQVDPAVQSAVTTTLQQLDEGTIRVAEKRDGHWQVNEWIKKAVLLSFCMQDNALIDGGETRYFDKVASKYAHYQSEHFTRAGVRVVPPATVRHGAYIASGTVLMPSYVNIGAYVDTGTMVDTWATVGSCAQIGKNVHLSGGVGIGGVLEPLQAAPTIIEDHCFIGARSEIVEGVIVEEGAVISMGVYIGQSTRIYDRARDEVTYGRVPAGAVVVPGNLPASNGKYSLYCAVIVKQVDAKTRAKVGINALLREAAEVPIAAATLYGIPNCDTIQKARGWLTEQGIAYQFHNYKTAGINEARLRDWIRQVGWETLLNRRSMTWRQQVPTAVKESIDEAGALRLMLDTPSIIKRPVLQHQNQLLVGFDPAQYAQLFAHG